MPKGLGPTLGLSVSYLLVESNNAIVYIPILEMHRGRRLQLREELVVKVQIAERGGDVEQDAGNGEQRGPDDGLLHARRGDRVASKAAGAADGMLPSGRHLSGDDLKAPPCLV